MGSGSAQDQEFPCRRVYGTFFNLVKNILMRHRTMISCQKSSVGGEQAYCYFVNNLFSVSKLGWGKRIGETCKQHTKYIKVCVGEGT